jgi:cytochrome c556
VLVAFAIQIGSRRLKLLVLCLLSILGACSQEPPAEAPPTNQVTPLGFLMKNEVNPTFSKLVVLVFHSDTLEMEPEAVKAELQRAGQTLKNALARVREWNDPPTQSSEGREVFYTFANSVDRATQRLVAAIEGDDIEAAATELEQIANTCNSCHHFFRLKIKDSVIPR